MAKIKTYANDNTINANDKLIGTDFNDSDKTKNYLISALKDYILNGLDVRPYKVYTALLTQTGTDAPIATVLENTIGNIWFTYDNVGSYFVNSNNLFTHNKKYLNIQAFLYGPDEDRRIGISSYDSSTVQIVTTNGLIAGNDNLYNTSIEIRVYN